VIESGRPTAFDRDPQANNLFFSAVYDLKQVLLRGFGYLNQSSLLLGIVLPG
jgi:hypothetical protein